MFYLLPTENGIGGNAIAHFELRFYDYDAIAPINFKERKLNGGKNYTVQVSWLWLVPAIFVWLVYGRNIRAKWFKKPQS